MSANFSYRRLKCATIYDARKSGARAWSAWRQRLKTRRTQRDIDEKNADDRALRNSLLKGLRAWRRRLQALKRHRAALSLQLWLRRWQRRLKEEKRHLQHLSRLSNRRKTLRMWRRVLQERKKRNYADRYKSELWGKVRGWLEEHEQDDKP